MTYVGLGLPLSGQLNWRGYFPAKLTTWHFSMLDAVPCSATYPSSRTHILHLVLLRLQIFIDRSKNLPPPDAELVRMLLVQKVCILSA